MGCGESRSGLKTINPALFRKRWRKGVHPEPRVPSYYSARSLSVPCGEGAYIYASLTPSSSGSLAMSLARRRMPRLRHLGLRRCPLDRRGGKIPLKPSAGDPARRRRVHLELRQLRTGPPAIPGASEAEAGKRPQSRPGNAFIPRNAGLRGDASRRLHSDPRNKFLPASAGPPPAMEFAPAYRQERCGQKPPPLPLPGILRAANRCSGSAGKPLSALKCKLALYYLECHR